MLTLAMIQAEIESQKQRGMIKKPILCEDCNRELSKTQLSWTKQNYDGLYCFRCQNNHSTKKSNKAYHHSNGDISFQSKFFKSINRNKCIT